MRKRRQWYKHNSWSLLLILSFCIRHDNEFIHQGLHIKVFVPMTSSKCYPQEIKCCVKEQM